MSGTSHEKAENDDGASASSQPVIAPAGRLRHGAAGIEVILDTTVV